MPRMRMIAPPSPRSVRWTGLKDRASRPSPHTQRGAARTQTTATVHTHTPAHATLKMAPHSARHLIQRHQMHTPWRARRTARRSAPAEFQRTRLKAVKSRGEVVEGRLDLLVRDHIVARGHPRRAHDLHAAVRRVRQLDLDRVLDARDNLLARRDDAHSVGGVRLLESA